MTFFFKGLSEQIQDLLVLLDLPQRGSKFTATMPGSSAGLWQTASLGPEKDSRLPPRGEEEPMQMGRARLSTGAAVAASGGQILLLWRARSPCHHLPCKGQLVGAGPPTRTQPSENLSAGSPQHPSSRAPIQFVVEVDASNDCLVAILSQRAEMDNKLHPCAFLSRRLTAAERDYSCWQ
ncbi:uncharacterized protein AB9W97_014255 isoform 1-T2 [Spinachia spinachia]